MGLVGKWLGWVRHGRLGKAWHGRVRQGAARHGMAGMARRVAARLGEARKGKVGLGWQG